MEPTLTRPCPTAGTLASTWLLGKSHLIPSRPFLHPIHSHRDICETQFVIQNKVCQKFGVILAVYPKGEGLDLLPLKSLSLTWQVLSS